MFYSHEILTSRKYGVATVWLVATLGQNSSLRKVSRKQILDVNVTKACETVMEPNVPLALRLQGNLLYGVSRVYSQQCQYMLHDAQAVHLSIKTTETGSKDANVDLVPAAKKARREDLLLPDDPAFFPEINFSLDIEQLLSHEFKKLNHSLTQETLLASRKSTSFLESQDGLAQLILPSDDFQADRFDDDQFMMAGALPTGRSSSVLRVHDDGALLGSGFEFDEDGYIIDLPSSAPLLVQGRNEARDLDTEDEAQIQVLREHQAAQAAMNDGFDPMDLDLPALVASDSSQPLGPMDDINDPDFHPGGLGSDTILDVSHLSAHAHRRKKRKAIRLANDTQRELRNRDLLDHSQNYLRRMRDAAVARLSQRMHAQAKKNAEHWILNLGLFGAGMPFSPRDFSGPEGLSSQFSGSGLYKAVTGGDLSLSGLFSTKKRSSNPDDGDASDELGRRVRARQGDDYFAPVTEDDGMLRIDDGDLGYGFGGGDNNLDSDHPERLRAIGDSELPLVADYEDISSAMPWNVSASLRGSSVQRGSVSAAGGQRGSRVLVSASPLIGRGRDSAPPIEEISDVLGGDGIDRIPESHLDEDFRESFPLSQAGLLLDKHNRNFLNHVKEAIHSKLDTNIDFEDMDSEDFKGREIGFAEMFAFDQTSRRVAVNAFLHVLALGNKNMIKVEQEEGDFGKILISVL